MIMYNQQNQIAADRWNVWTPKRGVSISENISVKYDYRRYHLMYGINVAKVGRRIRISSIWTRQADVLNCRVRVLLECMSSPDG